MRRKAKKARIKAKKRGLSEFEASRISKLTLKDSLERRAARAMTQNANYFQNLADRQFNFASKVQKGEYRGKRSRLGIMDVGYLHSDTLLDPNIRNTSKVVQTFVSNPRDKGVAKATKGAGKVAEGVASKVAPVATAKAGGKIRKAVTGVEDLFSATKKFERMGDTGEEFLKSYRGFLKGTRAQQKEAVEKWVKLGKEGFKLSDDVNEKMLKFLEKSGVEDVGEVGKTMKKWYADIAGAEKSRGLLDNEIENYIFHATTKEARESGMDYMKTLNDALKARKGTERTIEGTIKEINEWSLKQNGFNVENVKQMMNDY